MRGQQEEEGYERCPSRMRARGADSMMLNCDACGIALLVDLARLAASGAHTLCGRCAGSRSAGERLTAWERFYPNAWPRRRSASGTRMTGSIPQGWSIGARFAFVLESTVTALIVVFLLTSVSRPREKMLRASPPPIGTSILRSPNIAPPTKIGARLTND